MWRALLVGLFLLTAEREAMAQCRVKSNSNEGKLLAFYTAPIVLSMGTSPEQLPPASIRIGAEGEYIPKPNPAIEQTGACFTQKSEHTSLSPVFGRPRVTVSGPFGLAFEAAYLPPVTIARATPNLFSFAVSQARHFAAGPVSNETTLMLRLHGTFGNVKGAITCPQSQLQQTSPTSPCYGTSPSKDIFHPTMFGGEIAAGFTPENRGLSFYAGGGANRIDPQSAEARFGYAVTLVRLRRYVEARDRLVDATLTFPTQLAFVHALARLLVPSLENEIRRELKNRAEDHAVGVFARNLRSKLLAAPLRGRRVLAVDPGFRTGCKVAVVDPTGRPLAIDPRASPIRMYCSIPSSLEGASGPERRRDRELLARCAHQRSGRRRPKTPDHAGPRPPLPERLVVS